MSTDINHLAEAVRIAARNPSGTVQSGILHALIAIAERLPAPYEPPEPYVCPF